MSGEKPHSLIWFVGDGIQFISEWPQWLGLIDLLCLSLNERLDENEVHFLGYGHCSVNIATPSFSWRKKELFSIRKAGRFYPDPVYENFGNLAVNKENSCWFYGHIEKWEKCRTPAGQPAVWLWLFCIMFKGCQNSAFGRSQFSCGCLRWKIGWICPSLSPSLLSLLDFL